MKILLITFIVTIVLLANNVFARTVEVEVYGMTCEVCVDDLQRAFGKIDNVSNVEINLKQKKLRLETKAGKPTIESIKKTVLDAGFTPVKITVLSNGKG